MISVEALLKPISAEQPCGPDLSYDASLQHLETLVAGKPETQFGPAADPDWKELRDLSKELLGRSKHLKAAVILCLSLLKVEGLASFRDGLAVLRGLLEGYWAAVYPKLDPADNNDPTERMNLLGNLSAPQGTFGDVYRFIERLQQTPLCDARSMGRITLADVLAAANPIPAAEGTEAGTDKKGPNSAQIEAAFRDANPETLRATHDTAAQALEMVNGIDAFLTATLGAGRGADLDELKATLDQMQRGIAPFLAGGTGDLALEAAAEAGATDGGPARPGRSGQGYTGAIASRDDVLAALDEICKFYKQREPASPVPWLLKRARRLVKMNFMEIMNELTPDALAQLKVITGPDEETSASQAQSGS